jgi:hypothetical protein
VKGFNRKSNSQFSKIFSIERYRKQQSKPECAFCPL